ncbi:hypothetical protein KP509_21G004700 [Ceratopteris richardii]|uniref:Uncharacterized protein n=1 Tax=Ceratopteris richardii TaxID=49495 RepID=A0A8T2SA45_CERRI|nr:hypothetical protein KP509_21G004700 [Ceratopteris richardii]
MSFLCVSRVVALLVFCTWTRILDSLLCMFSSMWHSMGLMANGLNMLEVGVDERRVNLEPSFFLPCKVVRVLGLLLQLQELFGTVVRNIGFSSLGELKNVWVVCHNFGLSILPSLWGVELVHKLSLWALWQGGMQTHGYASVGVTDSGASELVDLL